jgi:hypothetical protein
MTPIVRTQRDSAPNLSGVLPLVAVHSQFLPGLFWPTVPSYIQRSGACAPHRSYHTTHFWERNIYFLDALKQGAKQLLTMSLVGTPRCGVRSAQRADPTKNRFGPSPSYSTGRRTRRCSSSLAKPITSARPASRHCCPKVVAVLHQSAGVESTENLHPRNVLSRAVSASRHSAGRR